MKFELKENDLVRNTIDLLNIISEEQFSSSLFYYSELFKDIANRLEIAVEKFYDYYENTKNLQLKIDVYMVLAEIDANISVMVDYALPHRIELEQNLEVLKEEFNFQPEVDEINLEYQKNMKKEK